jgi:hypothetical protein
MVLMFNRSSSRLRLFRNTEDSTIFYFGIFSSIVEVFHVSGIIVLPDLVISALNFIFISFLPGYFFLRAIVRWRKDIRTVVFSFIFSMVIVPVLVVLPALVFGELSWWMPILMVDAYLAVIFFFFSTKRKNEEAYLPTIDRHTKVVFLTCLALVGVYFAFQGNYWIEYSSNGIVTRTPHDGDLACRLAFIQGLMKGFPAYSPFLAGELEPWNSFPLQLFYYAIILKIPGLSSVAAVVSSAVFLDTFVSVLFAALLFYLCSDILEDWKTGVLSIIMYAFGTSITNPLTPGNEGFPQITRDLFFSGGLIENKIWEPAFVLDGPGGHIYFGTFHVPCFILIFSVVYFIGLFLVQPHLRYFLIQCILSVGLSLAGWPYYALYFVTALSMLLILGVAQYLSSRRSNTRIPVLRIFFLIAITVVSTLLYAYWQYSTGRVMRGITAETRLLPPFDIVVLDPVDGITHFSATLGACLPLGLIGLLLLYRTNKGNGLLHLSLLTALFSLFFLTDIYSNIDLQQLIAVSLYISSSFAVFVLVNRINRRILHKIAYFALLLLLFSSRLIFFASFFGQYASEVLGGEVPIQPIQNVIPPSYVSMCDWVRENTPEDSIFLICPYDPAPSSCLVRIPFFPMCTGRAVLCAYYPFYFDFENYRDANRIYSLMKSLVYFGDGWSPLYYVWEGELYRNVTVRDEPKSGFSVMLDTNSENNILQIDYLDVNPRDVGGNQYVDIFAQNQNALTKTGIIKLEGTYTLRSILVIVPRELVSKATGVYEQNFTFSQTYNLPISRIFVPSNLDIIRNLLRKYHVEYVVVSVVEKESYNATSFDFGSFPNLFDKIYDRDNIDIYKFNT